MLSIPLTLYSTLTAFSLSACDPEFALKSEAITYADPETTPAETANSPVVVRGANLTANDDIRGASVVDRAPPPTAASSARTFGLSKAWRRLQSFFERISDLDDTSPVNEQTAKTALQLIRMMGDYPIPQITASDEGEVVLTWYAPKARVEVFVDADLHITSLARVPTGFVDGDDVNWSGTLPKQLPVLLKHAYA